MVKRFDCNGAYGMQEHPEGEYALVSEVLGAGGMQVGLGRDLTHHQLRVRIQKLEAELTALKRRHQSDAEVKS